MSEDYIEIKAELNRIRNKSIAPCNSKINKKLAILRLKNFELYENFLLQYNKILVDLITSEKDGIINLLLEKVSEYGEDSLTETELVALEYYSNV